MDEDAVELVPRPERAEEMGVENMLPIPRENKRTPRRVVVRLGSLTVSGFVNPLHEQDQPPAHAPYTIPNESSPARLYDNTPQRTNVVAAVEERVQKPKSHGLTLSER